MYHGADVEMETVAVLRGDNWLRQEESVVLQRLTRKEAVKSVWRDDLEMAFNMEEREI